MWKTILQSRQSVPSVTRLAWVVLIMYAVLPPDQSRSWHKCFHGGSQGGPTKQATDRSRGATVVPIAEVDPCLGSYASSSLSESRRGLLFRVSLSAARAVACFVDSGGLTGVSAFRTNTSTDTTSLTVSGSSTLTTTSSGTASTSPSGTESPSVSTTSSSTQSSIQSTTGSKTVSSTKSRSRSVSPRTTSISRSSTATLSLSESVSTSPVVTQSLSTTGSTTGTMSDTLPHTGTHTASRTASLPTESATQSRSPSVPVTHTATTTLSISASPSRPTPTLTVQQVELLVTLEDPGYDLFPDIPVTVHLKLESQLEVGLVRIDSNAFPPYFELVPAAPELTLANGYSTSAQLTPKQRGNYSLEFSANNSHPFVKSDIVEVLVEVRPRLEIGVRPLRDPPYYIGEVNAVPVEISASEFPVFGEPLDARVTYIPTSGGMPRTTEFNFTQAFETASMVVSSEKPDTGGLRVVTMGAASRFYRRELFSRLIFSDLKPIVARISTPVPESNAAGQPIVVAGEATKGKLHVTVNGAPRSGTTVVVSVQVSPALFVNVTATELVVDIADGSGMATLDLPVRNIPETPPEITITLRTDDPEYRLEPSVLSFEGQNPFLPVFDFPDTMFVGSVTTYTAAMLKKSTISSDTVVMKFTLPAVSDGVDPLVKFSGVDATVREESVMMTNGDVSSRITLEPIGAGTVSILVTLGGTSALYAKTNFTLTVVVKEPKTISRVSGPLSALKNHHIIIPIRLSEAPLFGCLIIQPNIPAGVKQTTSPETLQWCASDEGFADTKSFNITALESPQTFRIGFAISGGAAGEFAKDASMELQQVNFVAPRFISLDGMPRVGLLNDNTPVRVTLESVPVRGTKLTVKPIIIGIDGQTPPPTQAADAGSQPSTAVRLSPVELVWDGDYTGQQSTSRLLTFSWRQITNITVIWQVHETPFSSYLFHPDTPATYGVHIINRIVPVLTNADQIELSPYMGFVNRQVLTVAINDHPVWEPIDAIPSYNGPDFVVFDPPKLTFVPSNGTALSDNTSPLVQSFVFYSRKPVGGVHFGISFTGPSELDSATRSIDIGVLQFLTLHETQLTMPGSLFVGLPNAVEVVIALPVRPGVGESVDIQFTVDDAIELNDYSVTLPTNDGSLNTTITMYAVVGDMNPFFNMTVLSRAPHFANMNVTRRVQTRSLKRAYLAVGIASKRLDVVELYPTEAHQRQLNIILEGLPTDGRTIAVQMSVAPLGTGDSTRASVIPTPAAFSFGSQIVDTTLIRSFVLRSDTNFTEPVEYTMMIGIFGSPEYKSSTVTIRVQPLLPFITAPKLSSVIYVGKANTLLTAVLPPLLPANGEHVVATAAFIKVKAGKLSVSPSWEPFAQLEWTGVPGADKATNDVDPVVNARWINITFMSKPLPNVPLEIEAPPLPPPGYNDTTSNSSTTPAPTTASPVTQNPAPVSPDSLGTFDLVVSLLPTSTFRAYSAPSVVGQFEVRPAPQVELIDGDHMADLTSRRIQQRGAEILVRCDYCSFKAAENQTWVVAPPWTPEDPITPAPITPSPTFIAANADNISQTNASSATETPAPTRVPDPLANASIIFNATRTGDIEPYGLLASMREYGDKFVKIEVTESGRAMRIRLGPLPSFTSRNFDDLFLTFTHRAVRSEATPHPNRTTAVAPIGSHQSLQVSRSQRQLAEGPASAGAVALAFIFPAQAAQAQRLSPLIEILSCPDRHWRDNQLLIEWPSALRRMKIGSERNLGWYLGSAVANCVAIAAFVGFHFAMVLIVRKARKAWSRKDDYDRDHSIRYVMRLAYFPTASIIPLLLFIQSTVHFATVTALYAPDIAPRAIGGLIGVVFCVLIPVPIAVVMTVGFRGQFFPYPRDVLKEKLRAFFISSGSWQSPVDPSWAQRYALIVFGYKEGNHAYLVVELGFSVVLGLIAAVRPSTSSDCTAQASALMAVYGIQFLLFAWRRPFSAPFNNAFFLLFYLSQAVIAAVVVAGSVTTVAGPEIALGLATMVGFLLTAKAVITIVVLLAMAMIKKKEGKKLYVDDDDILEQVKRSRHVDAADYINDDASGFLDAVPTRGPEQELKTFGTGNALTTPPRLAPAPRNRSAGFGSTRASPGFDGIEGSLATHLLNDDEDFLDEQQKLLRMASRSGYDYTSVGRRYLDAMREGDGVGTPTTFGGVMTTPPSSQRVVAQASSTTLRADQGRLYPPPRRLSERPTQTSGLSDVSGLPNISMNDL